MTQRELFQKSAAIDLDNAFVVVRWCEDCVFFVDGVEGFLSGDFVLKDARTHSERYPAHRITSERYPLKAESGRPNGWDGHEICDAPSSCAHAQWAMG